MSFRFSLSSLRRVATAGVLGLGLAAGPALAQHLDPDTGEMILASPAHGHAQLSPDAPAVERGANTLTLLGRLADGETRGFQLVGDILYRSNGGYLETIDVSNPEAPTVLGRYLVDQALVSGVAVSGNYAYVAAQRPNVFANRGSLRIVDVSDPSNPVGVGAITGRSFYDVHAVGTTVYTAALGGGLRIYDASNPAAPTELGFVTVSGGSVLGVDVVGTTAYVAAGAAGMRVIDVSNPAAPTIVGSFSVDIYPDINEFATDVTYANGYAYVTAQPLGLIVVDVSNPANPVQAGHYVIEDDGNHQIRSVAIDGTTAYVGKDNGVVALNVADPANITRIGTLDFGGPGSGQAIQVEGTTAWVSNRYHGVRVLDVANPAAMSQQSIIRNGGFSFKIKVVDNIAYVVDLIGQLRLIDISNPAGPVELGRVTGLNNPYRVDVVGGVAYVAQQYGIDDVGGQVTRIDVSNPANPTVIDSTPTAYSAYGVDVVDGLAFVGTGINGTTTGAVVAFSAEQMTPVGSVEAGNQAFDVRVAGGYAYAATFGSGLTVVDVSNPASMVQLSQGAVGAFSSSLEVDGSTVYLADMTFADSRGLTVVDVTNPSSPQELGTGTVISGGSAVDVAYANGYAYVTVDMVGVYQYDVTTPTAVAETAFVVVSNRATGVDVSGEYVVVTDTGAGIWIFRAPGGTSAEDGAGVDAFTLDGAYPNPFTGRTAVRYHLPAAGDVRVAVYSALGRRVATLVDGPQGAGAHEAVLEAQGLPAGVYFVRVEAAGQAQVRKVTLLR